MPSFSKRSVYEAWGTPVKEIKEPRPEERMSTIKVCASSSKIDVSSKKENPTRVTRARQLYSKDIWTFSSSDEEDGLKENEDFSPVRKNNITINQE
jgi:hypothetical protein